MNYLWLLFLPIACYLAWYIYAYTRPGKNKTRKEIDKTYYVRALKQRRVYTNDEYELELSRLRDELERIYSKNAAVENEIKSHDKRYSLFTAGTHHQNEKRMSIREAAKHKHALQEESYELFRQAAAIENEIRMLIELIRDRKRA